MKKNIDYNKPIACLTYGEFIDALKESLKEPIYPPKELPRFLTVPQLAELSGYTINTINIKNSKREIPGSIKREGRVLFNTEKILEWIESGSVKTKREKLNELDKILANRRNKK